MRHNSSPPTVPETGDDPATRLHRLVMDLVRVAGLLHPDQPKPGQQLSLSQAFALHELELGSGRALCQRDLAERLQLEKSTVSRMVANLESQGLLVRERDPANRRLYRLRITAKGRTAHARMGSAYHDQYVAMTAALSPAERDALLVGLPALIRVIRESYPSGHSGNETGASSANTLTEQRRHEHRPQ